METHLRLSNVSKSFPGVRALDGVDLEIGRGEVHGLLGENGAGKSTLVKVIAGVYRRDGGTLFFDGRERDFGSPGEASAAGITVIHQETSLIPTLSVLQNIFLGIEHKALPGIIDERRARKDFQSVCERLSFYLPAERQARDLSVAEQKMTEILKAMVRNASFIIMDEPTDALADAEIAHLFQIIRDLKRESITILYITHYLEEVFQISDRITVLRDGKKVGTRPTAELDKDAIVKMMIGQQLAAEQPSGPHPHVGAEALRVEGLSRKRAVSDVSFTAYQGEILGIAGVLGSGKTELARLLFGADRRDAGKIFVGGRLCRIASPVAAVSRGIGMVPEDRKKLGLILKHEIFRNISIAALPRFTRCALIRKRQELVETLRISKQLDIKAAGPNQPVQDLSGGNQQKVVIAKWLISRQKVLIMDEPTRGIDVVSKAEIHRIMRELADGGVCVIFISSEVPEIVKVSDRILVMQKGRVVAEYNRGVGQEEIVHQMLKGNGK
jgi:ribose transport system ATP-binding protein